MLSAMIGKLVMIHWPAASFTQV